MNMRSVNIKTAWDAYVHNHPQGTYCHLYDWKPIIEGAYKHVATYLMALGTAAGQPGSQVTVTDISNIQNPVQANHVVGVLPLVHITPPLAGKRSYSMPFLDSGNALGDTEGIARQLQSRALLVSNRLKAHSVEFRCDHNEPLESMCGSLAKVASNRKENDSSSGSQQHSYPYCSLSRDKVRMLLQLPDSSEDLFHSFKSKLRSQIKKPLKEGLRATSGGLELFDHFYSIFSRNMRDLGSPVHGRGFIWAVLKHFPERSRIFAIYAGDVPVAASLVIGLKSTLDRKSTRLNSSHYS